MTILPAPRATVGPVPNRGVLPSESAQGAVQMAAVLSTPYRLGSAPNTSISKAAVTPVPIFRREWRMTIHAELGGVHNALPILLPSSVDTPIYCS
jgi:hypothetical protein